MGRAPGRWGHVFPDGLLIPDLVAADAKAAADAGSVHTAHDISADAERDVALPATKA
ncbi:hypothetical protein ACFU7Y_27910 [Kitasatospora sp. NPDC057542]|uniref:hypothetical protein n=1 Tax=Streptomycetaceae TaxID=2062 RepID=UPI001CCA2797|nr:hypothetical protein [Streptomyces sp. LS1784]